MGVTSCVCSVQVLVLELETRLQKERERLGELRKKHYELAGVAEGWGGDDEGTDAGGTMLLPPRSVAEIIECLLLPPQVQAETSPPRSSHLPPPSDRLLSASNYLWTHYLSFTSFCLILCFLSQMKRCFF